MAVQGVGRRELRHFEALQPPPSQVELLFLEVEARAKIIFVIFAGTFDVAEFDFDFLVCASCAGTRTPAPLPITRARAAETRVCLRCGAAQLKPSLSRAHRRRSGPGRSWRQQVCQKWPREAIGLPESLRGLQKVARSRSGAPVGI